ncbi:MAG: hypothetical protein ABJB55_07805 [Actinomycetota bacterium]
MFARYFVELALDRERVERVLIGAPRSWLPGIATEANLHGDRLLAEVGVGDDVRIARAVTIDLGSPIRLPTKTVLPLRWTATGVSGLFPSLDADLEIAPLGQDRCQLSMSARYVPPLGALGRAIDRALLFRVAEATIKNFLDQVRDGITREVGMEHDGNAVQRVPGV